MTSSALADRLAALTSHDAVPPALYDTAGPYATVYLDASRDTESGAHEVELRWRAVRDELAAAGTPDGELQALAEAVDADASTPGRHGLVLVAAQGRVLWSARLPDPPLRPGGTRSPLPHLLPFLAQQARVVPHVLVVADRRGADLVTVGRSAGVETTTAEGDTQHPIHKTGRNDWSERHYQNRVDEAWEDNAGTVADAVAELAARHAAHLIVLAGDPRARGLVRDALAGSRAGSVPITELEGGGRAAGSDVEALAEAAREAVLHQVWRERRELLGHLRQNLGRERYAVAGLADVVMALRQAQVDTVVLSDDPSSTVRAAIGPAPTDLALDPADLVATGVAEPADERFDAALVRAVLGTGARLVVTPNAHEYVADGIAALLRYE